MKQENRFVAELFHYLAPFVDMEKELFICVDGGAATHHAAQDGGVLLDANVPDIWCAFLGHPSHIGIEAKVIENNSISVRQGQLQAWRTHGNGAYQPRFWVTTNRALSEFSCWNHTDIRRRLDETRSTVDNVKLSLSKYPASHQSNKVAELALFILNNARESI